MCLQLIHRLPELLLINFSGMCTLCLYHMIFTLKSIFYKTHKIWRILPYLKSTSEYQFTTNNSIFIPFSETGRHFETQNHSIHGAGCNKCLICYNIKHSKLQGLLQPATGMERFSVSKCLPVPENGMNTELFVVNYYYVDE